MYKKCLFLVCAVFVLEVKSDCDGYVECFSSFFSSFFSKPDANVEYINATSKNLPENFEVKDVQINELNKVLSEISSFIQQDITDQLKTQSDSAVFANVNPNTKVYVKTFTYNNPENILLPGLENINLKEEIVTEKDKGITEEVLIEQKSSFYTQTPQTTTKSNELKLIEEQNDISENEIPQSDDILSYYDSIEDNSTDYPVIDYVELYKDTTNEENVYNSTEVPMSGDIRDHIQEKIVTYVDNMEKFIEDINNSTANSTDVGVFPWVSTIFLKNDSKSNQFEYYCDGALLNERVLITAARCVILGNSTVDPASLLVILGKRSLLSMDDREQALKIKQIITHENFTNANGKVESDLALLVLESPAVFNEIIQPAIIANDTDAVDQSFTTAWQPQGDLVPVTLTAIDVQTCNGKSVGEHMFCASYGLNVALCPSYGGVYAGLQAGSWRLLGIRSGDTSDRGVCFDKTVWFTDLRPYGDWILEHFE